MNLINVINRAVEPIKPVSCWEIQKYLGSMLAIHMGEMITVISQRGLPIYEGIFKISLRNVYWVALVDRTKIVTSEDLTTDSFSKKLKPLALNSKFLRINQENLSSWIRFEFSGSFSLMVDAESCNEDSGDKFEIILPDGLYIVLNRDGVLQSLKEREPSRAGRWRE